MAPDPSVADPLGPGAARSADAASEERLLARIALGERSAFELFYRQYHTRLVRFLERMTRRTPLVDELLDDTMLVVWKNAGRFNGSCKPSTWVFAIAYRKALKAMGRLDVPVEDAPDDAAAATDGGPEQALGAVQLHRRLADALQQLSPEHRAVVVLTYFHGMNYREIGEVVACPAETVKTRMFHARRRLRALLPERMDDLL